jgi:hypothetical protein
MEEVVDGMVGVIITMAITMDMVDGENVENIFLKKKKILISKINFL